MKTNSIKYHLLDKVSFSLFSLFLVFINKQRLVQDFIMR